MTLHSLSSKVVIYFFLFFSPLYFEYPNCFVDACFVGVPVNVFCSLYDGPLLIISSFLSFLFSTMPRFPMTTCPTDSYMKSDMWQSQLRSVVPISKPRSLLEIINFCLL